MKRVDRAEGWGWIYLQRKIWQWDISEQQKAFCIWSNAKTGLFILNFTMVADDDLRDDMLVLNEHKIYY